MYPVFAFWKPAEIISRFPIEWGNAFSHGRGIVLIAYSFIDKSGFLGSLVGRALTQEGSP